MTDENTLTLEGQEPDPVRSSDLLAGVPWRVECGDSLELMAAMKSGSVDAVITDPPYMIGAISTGDAKSKAGSWVDLMNASFWYRAWMAESWRVLKDGGYLVIFLNWRTLPMLMKACADAKIETSSLAVWDKEWIGPAGPAQLRPTYEMMLFCGKGSGIEQSWDGAVWNAVTVTAGSGSTTATIDMTGKTNTLRLRCANGAVVAGLFGLTAASGVVFSNLSNSGSTAAQKAAVQANADYQAMIAAMPGDAVCVVLQLGLNDTARGAVNSAIAANVGVVADGYRAAFDGFPACDILAACQPNTPLSVQDLLSPLVRAWAEDNDAAFLDWQGYFGIPASSGDYAAYARNYTSGAASTALPLLEVDTTYRHPSPTADLVAAGKTAVLSGAGVVAHTLSNILLARSN